jgi:RNA polymerase sigma factor (sigma-70 family)
LPRSANADHAESVECAEIVAENAVEYAAEAAWETERDLDPAPAVSPLGALPLAEPSCDSGGDTPVELPSADVPLSELTDRQLLVALRGGSELHFGELYNRYFQRIYSFVYSRIRNHADAEEVVQETFTAVFRSFESYRGTSSLLSWIYGIAKNTLNNNLRRSKTEGQRLGSLSPEVIRPPSTLFDCNPEEHLNMRRYTEAIRDRLESVSPWQTEIFAMRHLENMSIQEIADRTHRSSDAIRSSLYRVKRLLFETAELSQTSISSSSSPPFDSTEQLQRG